MTPSPFSHPAQQTLKRIDVTVAGEPGSGKSAIGAYLLAAFRAQGFQASPSDALDDQPVDRTRFNQNTVIGVKVVVPVANAVPPPKTAREEELEKKVVDLDDKLVASQNQLAEAKTARETLEKKVESLSKDVTKGA